MGRLRIKRMLYNSTRCTLTGHIFIYQGSRAWASCATYLYVHVFTCVLYLNVHVFTCVLCMYMCLLTRVVDRRPGLHVLHVGSIYMYMYLHVYSIYMYMYLHVYSIYMYMYLHVCSICTFFYSPG